jgi:hypothetical protein
MHAKSIALNSFAVNEVLFPPCATLLLINIEIFTYTLDGFAPTSSTVTFSSFCRGQDRVFAVQKWGEGWQFVTCTNG